MLNRTMLVAQQNASCVILRVVTKENRNYFWFVRNKIANMNIGDFVVVKDGHSFAEVLREKNYIEVRFTWLKDDGRGVLTGRVEAVRVPAEFWDWMLSSPEGEKRTLAIENEMPQIVFQSRKNLKRVVSNSETRNKLSKFLSKNFRWLGAEKVVLHVDFEPRSFWFEEIREEGKKGLSGGVILHKGKQGMYYQIHT